MAIKYKEQPIVRMNKYLPLSEEIIQKLITKFTTHKARYKSLQEYYTGNHPILLRTFEDTSKPNNQCVNNFASYIVDVRNGYFTGMPITYMSDNLEYLAKLKEIFDINFESDTLSDIDKASNIKGHAFELLWIDEDSNIRFNNIEPDEIIMIYTADVSEKPLYAIRYYNEANPLDEQNFITRVFAYSDVDIKEYEMMTKDNKVIMNLVGIEPHFFGEVPIIEYLNNTDRMSSFEDVASLIDAYNNAQSDTVNEIAYFGDAYLKLKNMSATDADDISKMKENKVLLVEGDGDAEWLTKSINDGYIEHMKERIAKDIHKFSKTPNLVSDDFISNLSGTAIRYKVWGLEQDTAMKERKWRKSLKQRLKMITKIMNAKGGSYNFQDIDMTFNRNLPQNVTELGQMVSQLRGSVSTETLLGQLPFIENVSEEMTKLALERKQAMDEAITQQKAMTALEPNEPDTEPVE